MLRKKMMIAIVMVIGVTAIGCGSNSSMSATALNGINFAIQMAGVKVTQEVNTAEAVETVTAEAEIQEAETDNVVDTTAQADETVQADTTTNNTTAKVDNQGSTSKNHTHNFQPVYRTVHHDAVTEDQGHYENVMVQDAKYETKEIIHYGIACSCGAKFYADTPEEAGAMDTAHLENTDWDDPNWACGRSMNCSYKETINIKVSDPVYQTQWVSNIVTVQAAYDEKVLDHSECSCGARQ